MVECYVLVIDIERNFLPIISNAKHVTKNNGFKYLYIGKQAQSGTPRKIFIVIRINELREKIL